MVYWILGIITWFLIGLLGKMYYKRYIIKKLGIELWDYNTKVMSVIWVLCGPMAFLSIIISIYIADRTFMKDYK